MTRSILGAATVCAAALLLTGCSKSPPQIVAVEGVVLLNNQPLPNADIQFIPSQPGLGIEYIATATTDDNGRFKLTCKGQSGACACENKVTVMDGSMPETVRGNQTAEAKFSNSLKNRPIPSSYGSVGKTPLKIDVSAAQSEYKLELKR